MANANVVCRFGGVTVRSVTVHKTSPIDCTGAYHLSRGNSRLNELELAGTVTPERPASRTFEHVAHLTASHGVWREGRAGSDALRTPHAPLWSARLPGGPRPGSSAGCPRDQQLRAPDRRRPQAAGHPPRFRASPALAARRYPGQGIVADDLPRRLGRS